MSKELIDFAEVEKKLVLEHNRVRKDPRSYIPKLQELLSKFRDKTLYLPNENPMKTFEGKKAVEEAIWFLSKQKPLGELILNEDLCKAAEEHLNDIGPKGLTSHEGSNGGNVSDRIEHFCEWDDACAESIDFGFKSAENIILSLIVDDGVSERFQRGNLFSNELKYFGCAFGSHRDFNVCSVFVYAKGLRPLGQPSNKGVNYLQDYIQKTYMRTHPLSPFQEDDPDAPDDTVSVKIVKTTKKVLGKDKRIKKKIYTLSNQTQHIIEIEEN